ncbi:chitin deacetylase [Haplosporangium sp. Z 27]|nr:chitin deacetylase [Haplosporangium sp. Z 27]
MTLIKSTKKNTAMALVGSVALILSLVTSNSLVAAASKNRDIESQGINWPAYGQIPDTDSPEVQAWVKTVDWSKVPNLPVRKVANLGDPPECPKDEAPQEDCWWTCTGCFAEDDVYECPGKRDWGLTFDDGPYPGTTGDLLGLLKQKNATATFFVTGMKSSKAPELLQVTLDQGHHLASHTWSHPGLTTLTNEQIVAELKWTEKFIFDTTGYKVKYFRPPYGDVDNRVRAIARELGFKTVIWTSQWDTQDWQLEENTITHKQIVKIFNDALDTFPERDAGVITLEHDGDPKMNKMANTILDMGKAKGLIPMSIAQCLNDNPGYNAVPATAAPAVEQTTKAEDDQVKEIKPKDIKTNVKTKDVKTNNVKPNDDKPKEIRPKDVQNTNDRTIPPKSDRNSGLTIPKATSSSDNMPGAVPVKNVGGIMSSGSDAVSNAGFSVVCWTIVAFAATLAL